MNAGKEFSIKNI